MGTASPPREAAAVGAAVAVMAQVGEAAKARREQEAGMKGRGRVEEEGLLVAAVFWRRIILSLGAYFCLRIVLALFRS